jgi:hypothetical protein
MRLGQPCSGFATAVLTRTCDSDSRAPVALPTAPPLRARGLESDFAETENLEVGSSVRQGAGRVCGTGSAARH